MQRVCRHELFYCALSVHIISGKYRHAPVLRAAVRSGLVGDERVRRAAFHACALVKSAVCGEQGLGERLFADRRALQERRRRARQGL